jgi:hypothetical protein
MDRLGQPVGDLSRAADGGQRGDDGSGVDGELSWDRRTGAA